MIAYIKCLCGKNKLLASQMQEQGYEVRVTSSNPDWRKEASEYNVKLPFIVENGVAREIS